MKITEKLIDLTRDVYHNSGYFKYIGKTDLFIYPRRNIIDWNGMPDNERQK